MTCGAHPLSTGKTTPLIASFFSKKRAESAISRTEINFPSGFFAASSRFRAESRYSVSTKPGHTTLQVIPEAAYSRATDFASDESPVFAAAYAAFVLKPRISSVRVPPYRRIRPHCASTIAGSAAETSAPGNPRLAQAIACHSSRVVPDSGFCRKGPRATTRISAEDAMVKTIAHSDELSRSTT